MTLCWNLPQIAKRNNKVWKLFWQLTAFSLVTWDLGRNLNGEKKWRVEMIRTTLPGCALVDKISYGFWCFQLRSSKSDSLPAHVLMKSEHIPANQCIPLQASVHIIVYHCITRTKFDHDWGFQFWICLSVCLSVCRSVSQPASLPACLPACLCVCGGGGVCVFS